uniref:Uncharacterized protein n=1 Tax=Rhodosorus marinus TaxID=101924 RepID=A0A7S2ZH45_9RHOD|mmetsp:Transcript_19432/g.77581  ORF Transcript_19432/g.77581 Transcript_19432/m.77581 type:complete len:229 (+) Transcript_19432:411-1097(+)|eukprot:CAMPEP_0113962212 /NCGR_PEP_ID=MMETSP0011_2-20120614/5781_1 /TAXON_ID=101924 /ORGANISM="Rhodosorus marinus" /LENGTH=228 /DNA_ID=CAMNT_0000974023 /DNA_START=267 /DNA_END=953 /DNA_ORIENTATION=+ /assembly_acc=CAM_ASM_000156
MAFLSLGVGKGACGVRRTGPAVRTARPRFVVAAAVGRDDVMQLLTSDDKVDRLKGVNMARELDPAEGLNLLSMAAMDPDMNVRYATVSQLSVAGLADPEKTLELLRDLVPKETDMSVKAAAADAMCAIGLPEAFDDVEAIYHETKDSLVKFSIAAGLGELGNLKAFDLLKGILEDEASDDLLKVAALGSLGDLKAPGTAEIVEPFLEAEDASVKARAEATMSILKPEE